MTTHLAREYGYTTNTLRNIIHRNGGRIRPPKRPADKKIPVEDAIKRYAAGDNLESLGARYGVSRWSVKVRLKAHGVEIEDRHMRGPTHSKWSGGRHKTKFGYIKVWVSPDDPMASMHRGSDKYIFEHRLVMARHLGRPLERYESVHHLDGDRANNRIENLEIRRRYHGPGHHAYCTKCGSTDIGYR